MCLSVGCMCVCLCLYICVCLLACASVDVLSFCVCLPFPQGKGLAAFLKAIGFIIPLMDAEYANHYTREIMGTLIREFAVRPFFSS